MVWWLTCLRSFLPWKNCYRKIITSLPRLVILVSEVPNERLVVYVPLVIILLNEYLTKRIGKLAKFLFL